MNDRAMELLKHLFGGVWVTPDPLEQPELSISRWRIIEITHKRQKERRLSGFVVENQEGRLSTPLIAIDLDKKQCVTRSTRIYNLIGPPALDDDAEYVLRAWMSANGIKNIRDVSFEYNFNQEKKE